MDLKVFASRLEILTTGAGLQFQVVKDEDGERIHLVIGTPAFCVRIPLTTETVERIRSEIAYQMDNWYIALSE